VRVISSNRLLGIVLLALVLPGCRDSPTQGVQIASVLIADATGIAASDVIAVGQTTQLSAVLHDADGRTLTGATITWSSTDASVASVNGQGLVTGNRAGTATIVASAGNHSARLELRVCESKPEDVAELRVGQVLSTVAACAQPLQIGGGSAGAEYILVPTHASGTAAQRLPVTVRASGLAPRADFAASASRAEHGARGPETPHRDDAFHQRLREAEHRELTRRIGAARQAMRDDGLRAANLALGVASAVPAEGSLLSINVATHCDSTRIRTGRVAAVTQRAIVVVDTANPSTGITDAEYRSFGIAFDTLVHPLTTAAFGEVQDVDKNGRTVIFYTRVVNELTRPGSSGYVGGFFWSGNLFPKTASNGGSACANSNFAELFFLLAPDPQGVVNGNVRTDDLIRATTISVMAHEFQHVINASRRLYVNQASTWEETWLNEGLSHIAEELTFFRASRLAPNRRLTAADLQQTTTAWDAFSQHQLANHRRLVRYLEHPSRASIAGDAADLATRGAGWAFLRYAADRLGRDEMQLWQALANSRTAGFDNLRRALGVEPVRWIQDWNVAMAVDGSVAGLDPIFTTRSWDHRSALTVIASLEGRYPLRIDAPVNDLPLSFDLAAGSAAYLRLAVDPGRTATVHISSSGGLPSERLRLSLVRIR
jgi:hypothetical protein